MQDDGSTTRRGTLAPFQSGREFDYVLQRHFARRAGEHLDLRLGNPAIGLYSWAVPKARLPERPGESLLSVATPIHRYGYRTFEGEIPQGHGAGTVKREDMGTAAVTGSSLDKLRFALLHHRFPKEYQLTRKRGDNWFLTNVTPTQSDAARYGKVHYRTTEQPEEQLGPDVTVSPKIDGAAILLRLLADRAEVSSIRERKEGGPIRHTWKVQGLTGLRIPEELQGTVLRGELYGKRGGKTIPAAELGGLLNTDTLSSRAAQREKGTRLLIALYGMADPGKLSVPKSRPAMRALFSRVSTLTGGVAHPLPEAEGAEAGQRLVQQVRSGRHPLTREGVVLSRPGEVPTKAVFRKDADVYIRGIFPADTKSGTARAGGFLYSLSPNGPVVGRIGSGISRQDAEDMLNHPHDWVGRVARIRAHSQFPSGAWRAPVFIARHEG